MLIKFIQKLKTKMKKNECLLLYLKFFNEKRYASYDQAYHEAVDEAIALSSRQDCPIAGTDVEEETACTCWY